MFGKRSNAATDTIPRPSAAAAAVEAPPRVEPAPMKIAQAAPVPSKAPPRVQQLDQRSED